MRRQNLSAILRHLFVYGKTQILNRFTKNRMIRIPQNRSLRILTSILILKNSAQRTMKTLRKMTQLLKYKMQQSAMFKFISEYRR